MLTYYIFCTYIDVPTKSTIEEAVYPPQVGDFSPPSESMDSGKEDYVAREKEVSPV
jgi:hypothetical protein